MAVVVPRSLLVGLLCLIPSPAFAQHDHTAPAADGTWTWAFQGRAFLNLNIQARKFRDFTQLESQNWGMASVSRQSGRMRWTFHAMGSVEPWSLRRLGSAQVLQVGETLDGGPLLDYQHPHDLLMALEARVEWAVREDLTVFVEGGPVGAPALGPSPFMHRASAGPNPTAPLSHHMLDSQHISHGVISLGVQRAGVTLGGSVFRGREPDENRLRLDMGALDSFAGRLAWQRGAWRAQVSSAHINEPESTEPGDVVRSTASLEYTQDGDVNAGTAWLAAWGRNERSDHAETGWMLEGRRSFSALDTAYARAELVDRFILVDFDHAARTGQERHLRSTVAALTIGYERALRTTAHTRWALGADVTLHRPSANLRDSYGQPVSWHVFLRVAGK